jgi:cell division protein FtsN
MGFFKNEDRFELHLDHGRLVLVAIGALLVGALLFLLGMLVGRNVLTEPPDPMARVEAATAVKVVEPAPVAKVLPEAEPKKPEYTFYENVKKPDGQETESLTSKRKKPVAEEKNNATLIVPRTAERQEQEGAPGAETAPTKPLLLAPEKPSPKAAASPDKSGSETATASTGKTVKAAAKGKADAPLNLATVFTVQVSSFKKRSSAENMAGELRAKGIKALVREVDIKGVTWYRVQVGEFATKNEARHHYDKKLKPKGIKGFILTR